MMLDAKEAAALAGLTDDQWRYRIRAKKLPIPTYQMPGSGSRPVYRWKRADVERMRDQKL